MAIQQKLVYSVLLTLVLCLSAAVNCFALQVGEPFPEFSMLNTLSPEERAQLKIPAGKELSLGEIGYNVILIEFLNVYCHTCRQQVKIFNDLYAAMQKDPVLSRKACMLGIAVGNTLEEVNDFKKNFEVAYPVVADPQKAVFNLTGNVRGTPQTYILSGDKKRFIIDYHPGAVSSPERYLRSLQSALRGEITGIELGNKVPVYTFSYQGKSYSQKDFTDKKVLIYCPARKTYELPSDGRRPPVQLQSLSQVATEFPEVQFIIFPSPEFPQALLQKMSNANVYFPEKADSQLLSQFAVNDDPSIYYVNQYGRISFMGPCISLLNAREIFKGKDFKTAPAISDAEIIKLIEKGIKGLGKQTVSTEKTTLENGTVFYVTLLAPRTRGVYLFSRVESKMSVCDVCHDSHFIYIFDQQGTIKGFIPIALTKYGNVPWTAADIKKMKKLLIGKSIFDAFVYHPKVDAVSTATMTSSLIFEALQQAKTSFADFKDYQFRKEHWEALCFHNMCTIKDAIEKMKQAGLAPVINGAELDFEHMTQFLSDGKRPTCPLGGNYLPIEGNILCSVHGINQKGCKK